MSAVEAEVESTTDVDQSTSEPEAAAGLAEAELTAQDAARRKVIEDERAVKLQQRKAALAQKGGHSQGRISGMQFDFANLVQAKVSAKTPTLATHLQTMMNRVENVEVTTQKIQDTGVSQPVLLFSCGICFAACLWNDWTRLGSFYFFLTDWGPDRIDGNSEAALRTSGWPGEGQSGTTLPNPNSIKTKVRPLCHWQSEVCTSLVAAGPHRAIRKKRPRDPRTEKGHGWRHNGGFTTASGAIAHAERGPIHT